MILDDILQMPLLDHHAHGLMLQDLDVQSMGDILNESSSNALGGAKAFDKPVGLNIRTFCAPLLDLPPHIPIEDYLLRRRELGAAEVSKRFVEQSSMSAVLLDSYDRQVETITTPAEFESQFKTPAFEILRIESIFENVAMRVTSQVDLMATFADELASLAEHAVGLKSIVAYRTGFRIDTANPNDGILSTAIDAWLKRQPEGQRPRLDDPAICARLLWIAANIARERQMPIQMHVGIGDDDVDMPANDPGHFTNFFADMQGLGVRITLLHCYPYVRSAQWLADVYDNVYYDIGFMPAFGSPEILRVMRESMEIGPFHKILYSSDAFSLAELFYISAYRFRRMLAMILQSWLDEGYCSCADALRIAERICSRNAAELYRLDVTRTASGHLGG